MSDEIRINRQPPVQPQQSARPIAEETEAPAKVSKMPWAVLGVIVLVLIIIAVLFRGSLFKGGGFGGSSALTAADLADRSAYQAVFLTNGQVYFGKISNPDGDYVTMDDIFYLQVGPAQGSGASTTPAAGQGITLVKLGQELHGPVDEMHINRSQILFYEDLKSDGQVVKAIMSYKANPTGATPAK